MTRRTTPSEHLGRRSHSLELEALQPPAVIPRSVESPGGHRAALIGEHPSAMIGPALLTHEPSPTTDLLGSSPDGYLGPTSYAAIFRESGEDKHQFQAVTRPATEDDHTLTGHGQYPRCNLEDPSHIKQGAAVLHCFPSRDLCDLLIDRYYKASDVVLPEVPMRYCHDSIWSTFGKSLDSPRDQGSVMAMSQVLCKTAMSPTPASSDTEDWMSSFCGHRLRWEVIGNYSALFGLAVMIMSDWDPMFTDHRGTLADRNKYAGKMRECAEACLALCNDIDALNEWVIALMVNAYSLQSLHEGDASQQLWRRHGGMANAVTAAGLHREVDPAYSPNSSLQPSFLVVEFCRRLFCTCFAIDKQLTTFMGRPPVLSRRYATCKVPLDLIEEEMMASGSELDAIRSRLDSDGWNTSGVISPNTYCRGWISVMVIRDEILELALGPSIDGISERRDELKKRSEERYAQMPEVLQYKPKDPSLQTASALLFSINITFYLEWLLNNFILDRLPDGGSAQSKQSLIKTARKMLDGVLVLSANRDRLRDNMYVFVWTISYFGIPSAAFLSIELLRQSKFPSEFRLHLPRSEIIQNLSVFIGCLEWVRPSEGNYTLCMRMRKVIKRILDQVLELPPPSGLAHVEEVATPADPAAPELAVPELPISSMFEAGDEPDFLEWLNSVDWTRDMLQDAWT